MNRARMLEGVLVLKDFWNLVLLVLRNLQPVMVLAVVGLVAWALLARQTWPFSVAAESEHVTLHLAPDLETNWRIEGALLCVRSNMTDLGLLPIEDSSSPCKGSRWKAYDLSDVEEVTLRVPAMSSEDADDAPPENDMGYAARLDVEPDGSLAILVTAEGKADTPLVLLLGDATAPLELGRDVILAFPKPEAGSPAGRLLLPFSGSGTIGKDVSWWEPTLLRRGSVSLYTRSAEAAGGRDLVATADLLPGDRLDVGLHPGTGGVVTKGFVHFDLWPEPEEPPAMTVVAFGEAESIQIVRFGDQGYSFSPALLARLTRHSAVSTWAVLVLSLLGFMAIYREGSEIGSGDFLKQRRRFVKRWRRFLASRERGDD